MQEISDAQLLRRYATEGDEAAFSGLVTRHMDLVYSAALRQVESSAIASDITQCVFVDLARKAQGLENRMASEASLVGWLYRSTRYAVLTHLRDDRRRVTHETQAMEQLLTSMEPAPDWDRVRPLLDDAMSSLCDEDREALLLRYFKGQDFRAVGAALGVSDDAAQKRVSRAVERLREFFAKRGVTGSAVALATLISSNAVQAAPAGLGATIASLVAVSGTTAISTATTLGVSKAIYMTTMQKTIITTTLILAVGGGAYELCQNLVLRNEMQVLQQTQAPLRNEIQRLQAALAQATNRLQIARDENEKLRRDTADIPRMRGQLAQLKSANREANDGSEARQWMLRATELKARMASMPNQSIPELQLLTEKDWLDAAKETLETDEDYHKAMAGVRNAAQYKFAPMLHSALQDYMKAHDDQFPKSIMDLQPYLPQPADETMLQRYQIIPKEKLPSLNMGGDWIISQKQPVEKALDSRTGIGPNGWGGAGPQSWELDPIIDVILEYKAAHNNSLELKDPSQLAPYVHSPEQQAALNQFIERSKRAASNSATSK